MSVLVGMEMEVEEIWVVVWERVVLVEEWVDWVVLVVMEEEMGALAVEMVESEEMGGLVVRMGEMAEAVGMEGMVEVVVRCAFQQHSSASKVLRLSLCMQEPTLRHTVE